MAKVNRRGLTHLSGSVGEYTYRQVNGETIMSMKRQGEVGLPTNKQMLRRIKWANLVNMAKLLHQYKVDDIAFPGLSGMSWLNKFIKMNANRTISSLTKEDAGKGMAIADNYKLSEGTIDPWDGATTNSQAPFGTTDADDKPIFYWSINATGTVPTNIGSLSNWILNNFPALQDKDVLTFVLIYSPHTKDSVSNKWFGSQVGVRQIRLDKSSSATLPSWLTIATPEGGSTTDITISFLGPKGWGSVYCDDGEPDFCLVGRGADIINTTEVTGRQTLPQTAYFSSDDYIKDAIESYGGSKPVPFLQPGADASASNEAEGDELAIDSNHQKSPMEAKKAKSKK